VELCEARRDNVGGARALRQLADVLFQQKNNDLAASVAAHSLTLGTNLREKALTRVLLGRIEQARSDPGRAREYLQEALESFTRMRDRHNASASRSLLGSLSSL